MKAVTEKRRQSVHGHVDCSDTDQPGNALRTSMGNSAQPLILDLGLEELEEDQV